MLALQAEPRRSRCWAPSKQNKTCWSLLARATGWSDHVFEPQNITSSFGGVLRRRPRWRSGDVMCGPQLIKHGCFALLGASGHAVGVEAMLEDWRYSVGCEIHMRCDSRAARGKSARLGTYRCTFLVVGASGARRTIGSSPCTDQRQLARDI